MYPFSWIDSEIVLLPTQLGGFLPKKLSYLSATHNELSQVPRGITRLKHLAEIHLSHNNFTTLVRSIHSFWRAKDGHWSLAASRFVQTPIACDLPQLQPNYIASVINDQYYEAGVPWTQRKPAILVPG